MLDMVRIRSYFQLGETISRGGAMATEAVRTDGDRSLRPRGEYDQVRPSEADKQRWMEENREAFRAFDEHVLKNGLFGDGKRLF